MEINMISDHKLRQDVLEELDFEPSLDAYRDHYNRCRFDRLHVLRSLVGDFRAENILRIRVT
jgi:hypothetical protein